jgi:hypothetical protein
MKVFHGSYTEITKVDISYSEILRDFGKGFYVTKLYQQAKNWAIRKGRENNIDGFVTEFDFNENTCKNLKMKLLHFEDYNDEWLNFVVLNRKNDSGEKVHDYDIVEGPVADDKITTQIDDYIAGNISREQFLNDLVYNPSHQICFCTVQSLQALTLTKSKIDFAIYHTDDEILQNLMTDYGKSELEAADIYFASKTYTQFSDETSELYKKPWQEIYEMLKKELNLITN